MANNTEPKFETQLDYYGRPEKVDVTKQSIRIICTGPSCTRVRYIHIQDRFQVDMCKPCARAARLASRARRAREKRIRDKSTK